jgi:hypothetical protein
MKPLKEVFNNAFYTHLAAEFNKADKTLKPLNLIGNHKKN